MKLLTLITAIGLVAAALTTPQAIAQTATQSSQDCLEEFVPQNEFHFRAHTGNTPIFDEELETCRAAESNEECFEHHGRFSVNDGGLCRWAQSHNECPNFDPTTDIYNRRAGEEGCVHIDTFLTEAEEAGHSIEVAGQSACLSHVTAVRANHDRDFVYVRYDETTQTCRSLNDDNECREFWGADWLELDENGACRPRPLVVHPLPEIESEDIAGEGTEDTPYEVAADSVGEFTITVSVAAGSGNYEYTAEDAPMGLTVNDDGVVSFDMESTVAMGEYTVAVWLLTKR